MTHPQLAFAIIFVSAGEVPSNDGTLYCNRVRARAWSDAAPLLLPVLLSEMLRFPNGTPQPEFSGGTYQVRVGLSYSLSDIVRGAKTISAGDADCALEQSRLRLNDTLPSTADIGKLTALKKQLSFLEAQRGHWQNLIVVGKQRLAARGITYLDFNELQKRVTSLDRKGEQLRGEIERIQAEALPDTLSNLATAAATYAERSDTYERRSHEARMAQAWQIAVSGGVIPLQLNEAGERVGRTLDWYGLVQIGMRFGIFAGDAGFLDARNAEVRNARYEVPQKITQLERQLDAAKREAASELATVEHQLKSTRETFTVLQNSNADNAAHAMALLSLDAIDFEADAIFLRALVEELARVMGAPS